MKSYLKLYAALLILMTPCTSFAKDKACLIDGSFVIMGQKIISKDCMQAAPNEEESDFKSSCNQLASTSATLGGQPGKITYSASCPQPSQGICAGFLGGKKDAYYYARSPSDLKDLPASCAQGGGRWRSGR